MISMPEGAEGRSSTMSSGERAMGLAFDLIDKGDEVLRIERPARDVTAQEVQAALASRNGRKRWRT